MKVRCRRLKLIWIFDAILVVLVCLTFWQREFHERMLENSKAFLKMLPRRNCTACSTNRSLWNAEVNDTFLLFSLLDDLQINTSITNLTIESDKRVAPQIPFYELFDVTVKMQPEGCNDDFGFGLVDRWRNAGRKWCNPSISCYAIKQNNHGGDGDNLCVIENATLDLASVFNKTAQMQDVVSKYKSTTHFDKPYVHFDTQLLSTECQKDEREWRNEVLPGWNSDWMLGGLNVKGRQECIHYEKKPLLVIQRDEFANFYHDSEDFFNAFLTLLILRLDPSNLTVLLSDLYPWGPFESLWKHIFPDVHTVWEMKDMLPTCYPQVVIGIYGPASPLTLINQGTGCYNSPLVKAYSRWVWSSFHLDYLNERPISGAVKLLWMSRKSSVLWPEQAYCDDRYFRCADWQHLGVRPLGRVLQNEDEVVAVIRARPNVEVNQTDFNNVPFAEQIRTVYSSDVIAGPHGAGLTHLLFLPDRSCVFEIFIDESQANIHYQNMAAWRGIAYHSMTSSNPAPAIDLVNNLWSSCIQKVLPSLEQGKNFTS